MHGRAHLANMAQQTSVVQTDAALSLAAPSRWHLHHPDGGGGGRGYPRPSQAGQPSLLQQHQEAPPHPTSMQHVQSTTPYQHNAHRPTYIGAVRWFSDWQLNIQMHPRLGEGITPLRTLVAELLLGLMLLPVSPPVAGAGRCCVCMPASKPPTPRGPWQGSGMPPGHQPPA